MTKEQRDTVSFGLGVAVFVIWLGFVGWTLWQQAEAKRATRAALARLEDIAAGARVARGGDGATITAPAPSDN